MRRIIPSLLAVVGIGLGAAVAQQWSGFQIVGGASYCSSTQNGVCVNTVAAGPTTVTGNETIPADTNLSNGQSPQTVKMSMASLNVLPSAFETHPTTASSTIVSNNVGMLFVTTAAAAKLGYSVQLPSSPVDNQKFTLATDRSITGIGFSPNTGQSLNGGTFLGGAAGVTLSETSITTTAGATGLTLMYRLSNTTWYRIQ